MLPQISRKKATKKGIYPFFFIRNYSSYTVKINRFEPISIRYEYFRIDITIPIWYNGYEKKYNYRLRKDEKIPEGQQSYLFFPVSWKRLISFPV